MGCCPCFAAKSRNNKLQKTYNPSNSRSTRYDETSSLSNTLLTSEDMSEPTSEVSMRTRNTQKDNVVSTYHSPMIDQKSSVDSNSDYSSTNSNAPRKKSTNSTNFDNSNIRGNSISSIAPAPPMRKEDSRQQLHRNSLDETHGIVKGVSLLTFEHFTKRDWLKKRGQLVILIRFNLLNVRLISITGQKLEKKILFA